VAKRKSFLLRIPPELYRDLEIWARDELRSVNGQIEFLLRRAVDRRRGRQEPRDQADEPKKPEDSMD
jgi:hypothetical protein